MKLEVIQKEENKKLVTKQTEGPFKRWESIQEFHGPIYTLLGNNICDPIVMLIV